MKKIFLGFLALSLMSGTTVSAKSGKKKAKARTTNTTACPKTCPKGHCPIMGN
ncbi:MAG: hypothetical protein ABJA37_14630 [Ferruginibacter sp.]